MWHAWILLPNNQDDMLIAKDEIFGPVQAILKFKWVKYFGFNKDNAFELLVSIYHWEISSCPPGILMK